MGIDRATFDGKELKYDPILRDLELIGEAATQVPAEVRQQHADIPRRQVIATRNRLIHGYLGIDNDTLRGIVSEDIDPLIVQLRRMLDLCWFPADRFDSPTDRVAAARAQCVGVAAAVGSCRRNCRQPS